MRDRLGRALFSSAVILGVIAPASAFAYPRPGITERVSVSSDGTQAGNSMSSSSASISSDGRYVAFRSDASNLVPGDTNRRADVFVHDRATRTTERVSVASDGAEANFSSYIPSISADGRHVAFSSDASNLVPGDTNGFGGRDVFVHDRASGTTERVSVASDGTEANSYSYPPAISADGRHVAFYSNASNLVPGDTNESEDMFVHDRATRTTERVSVASDGTEANASSLHPAISADGRYIAFSSQASNLVPGDTNAVYDVFVHDRVTGTTERVSVAPDGAEANSPSYDPAFGADGRHVAFESLASNLVPADTNGAFDVFVHDRATGTTERVSVASDGAEGRSYPFSDSYYPAISPDGRHVAFRSDASNLVPGDSNGPGVGDVFVHDRATGITERVSVASDGAEANFSSFSPAISADGRYVAFHSGASNLVPGDTNGVWDGGAWDVFVHDRGGSLGVLGTPSVLKGPGDVGVSGRATFSGATLAGATDPDDDGTRVGPLQAADVGAELTGAAVIYRPEQEDLLLRLDLSFLPSAPAVPDVPVFLPGADLQVVETGAGLPGVLYGAELRVGETRYEVRALRAGATAAPPRAPYVALYRCSPDCTEHASLTGSFGTTGDQVLVSVPLSVLEATDGSELTDLRAFTAAGEATPGTLVALDEVPLSSALIPASRVELGISDASTPEDEVAFTVDADLTAGDFSGTVPTAGLSPGSYRVWARACLGDSCGSAVATPVTVGELVEKKDTNLELTVEGRGQDMTLRARLTDLDTPSAGIEGRTIDFYSDDELIGSALTDSNGVAAVPVPPGHRGANRDYVAVFAGDYLYRGSSDERPGQGGGRGGGEAGGTTQVGRSYRGAVLLL